MVYHKEIQNYTYELNGIQLFPFEVRIIFFRDERQNIGSGWVFRKHAGFAPASQIFSFCEDQRVKKPFEG